MNIVSPEKSGTLMQNRHDELFYLMDLVRPSLLGDWNSFNNDISKPITYARAKDAKTAVLQIAAQCEQMLRDRMRPAYLERKKEDVLKDSLTQKREKVVFCELTEIQKKIYRHIIALPDYQYLRFGNAPCGKGFKDNNPMHVYEVSSLVLLHYRLWNKQTIFQGVQKNEDAQRTIELPTTSQERSHAKEKMLL
jgi:SNF2 family DNA or RNA helicase